MPEHDAAEQIKLAADAKLPVYNQKTRELFAESDAQPMDSPKRDAVVEKIMALWVAEG